MDSTTEVTDQHSTEQHAASEPSESEQAPAELTAAHADVNDPEKASRLMARLGLEKKAEDVTVLDIRAQHSYADFIVLMSAGSEPQLSAIADHVEMSLKKLGRRPMSVEGLRGGQWVLMDYGDVVLHIFLTDARSFYDLEGLWADAQREVISDDS